MSFDANRIQKAAGRLGDAIVDPAIWPEIMDDISRAVGAEGAVLLQSDAKTPDIPHTKSLEEVVRIYFQQEWHTRDLRANRGFIPLSRGVKVVVDQEVISSREMQRETIYQDFLRPVRLKWFAGIGFRAGDALWGMSLQRTPQQGPFDSAEKDALISLSDRLTAVATLSTVLGRRALSGVIDALQLVPQPALIIDWSGFVIQTNDSAEKIFDDDARISLRRLKLADESAKRSLDHLLDRLRLTSDLSVVTAEPIVALRKKRPPLVIKAYPIDGAARGPFLGARALLLLTELTPKKGPGPRLLIQAFGLSKATLRNQLKVVFAKTNTNRQAELVALLANAG